MAKKKSAALRDLLGAVSSTKTPETEKMPSKNSDIENELDLSPRPEEDVGDGAVGHQFVHTAALLRSKKLKGKQMSVYLEPSLHKRLRECAHKQDTKMHPIIIEGIVMALNKREALIKE